MHENLTQKKLRDELLVDIASYKEHPDCNQLVVFIYDSKYQIKNPLGFIKDLEKQGNEDLKVRVFINPI